MTTNRTRTITKTPLLAALALAFGLAVSASGCIISDTGDTGPGCLSRPLRQLRDPRQQHPRRDQLRAAGADTVRITVNDTPIDYQCNTGPTVQTVTIPLDVPGSVTVFVELFGYGQRLSSVNQAMSVYVGCAGYEILTPAELPVVL